MPNKDGSGPSKRSGKKVGNRQRQGLPCPSKKK